MTKNEIRRSILKIRDSQSPEEILEKSKRIKERLFSLEDFIKAENVLFYYSFRSEVRTDIMIKDCGLEQIAELKNLKLEIGKSEIRNPRHFTGESQKSEIRNPKLKRIFLPKVVGKELEIFEIKSLADVKLGFCRIPEPITERPVELADIELVIVPGVCFDKKGFRIGYGGGYYDRLLLKLTSQKIGLAFDFQIIDKIPNTSRDMRVDMVVSDIY